MTAECNQFVFGFHPQSDARSERSSMAGRSPATVVVYCCGRSRSALGSCSNFPPASPIIGIPI